MCVRNMHVRVYVCGCASLCVLVCMTDAIKVYFCTEDAACTI